MGEWALIEDAVVSGLAGLRLNGRAVLATVRGCNWRDRKLLAAAIGRERMPAAYVMVTGRAESDKEYRRAGSPQVTVLYATRSERQADDARTGGVDTTGVFEISELAGRAMNGLALGDARWAMLVEEGPLAGDDSILLWEQRFEVRRGGEESHCMFGGDRLVGWASHVELEVAPLSRAVSRFAFPGVDGVFERLTGIRERPIRWRGQIRTSSGSALDAIELKMERLIQQGRVDHVTDGATLLFTPCVISSYKRRGGRRRDHVTDEVLQDFELEFVQLFA